MNAIIVSTGEELVTGQTVDTNSAYLSRRLAERGIATIAHITVGDSQAAIAEAMRTACAGADLVLLTGGLGPTADDLSRQALAEVMGTRLEMDEDCLAEITEFFRQRGRAMNETNSIQAMIPVGAQPLRNAVGTAPGIAAVVGQSRLFVMPGVPSEMEWMFQNVVAPRLGSQAGVILHHIVHTFGQGESDVASAIADLMKRGANPLVGTTVAAGMVSVRIVSRAADEPAARRQIAQTVASLRQRLGKLIIGEGEETLPVVLGSLLRRRRQTLAVAESCTGGLIGQMITSVAGSSDYFLGGAIAYANAVKQRTLEVPPELLETHGAVSEPVARAMAEGCRHAFGSDWALSVTGIAGPGGGSEAKPVGLVYIGLSGPAGTQVHRTSFPGVREIIRLRAALSAMNYLRLALLETQT